MSGHPTPDPERDRREIATVLRTFFAAFTSGPGSEERVTALRELFLPGAVVVRTCGDEPVADDVDSFLAPRRRWLADGTLVDFREAELTGSTEVFGDVAAHFCRYAKTGLKDGAPAGGRGMKSVQLVRTSAGWRISAVAWDDEREGVLWPDPGPSPGTEVG